MLITFTCKLISNQMTITDYFLVTGNHWSLTNRVRNDCIRIWRVFQKLHTCICKYIMQKHTMKCLELYINVLQYFRMSGKSTPKSSTPRSTPPRMTPTRTSPPRGTTPTRLNASKIALTKSIPAASPAHTHAHSLSMLGAERYQNQLSSTANAELFK